MSRPRDRKDPEEDGSGYSWMDTYGDLVTLLLCFFVLLYSFSSIDAEKWQELVGAFSGKTAVSVDFMDTQTVKQDEVIVEGVGSRGSSRESGEPDSGGDNAAESPAVEEPVEDFDKLYAVIKLYIEENNLDAMLSIAKIDNIILVRFKEAILFQSGKAQILEESKPVLNHIIDVIGQNIGAVKMIRIEGHTDNVPIHTAEFDSNWELSMARAGNALQYFISSGKISPDKLSAAAYGEYQPIETNETEDGRATNRRVDFVIEKADEESSEPDPVSGGN